MRRVYACCRSATLLVSVWLKQRLTLRRKDVGDRSMSLQGRTGYVPKPGWEASPSMVRAGLPKPQLCVHARALCPGNARYSRTYAAVWVEDDAPFRRHSAATTRTDRGTRAKRALKTDERKCETMGSPTRGDPQGDRVPIVLRPCGIEVSASEEASLEQRD